MTDDPAVMRAMLHDLNLDRPHQIGLLDLFANEAMGRLLDRMTREPQVAIASGSSPQGNPQLVINPLGEGLAAFDEYNRLELSCLSAIAYDVAEAMLREREKRLTNPPA